MSNIGLHSELVGPGARAGAARAHFQTLADWPAWLVCSLTFAWLAATAWMRPLALPDEGRYVGVAWEMLCSGHWLVPTLDGLPFFHKPPLFYWLSAGSMMLFGPTEWAARMPSMIAATAVATALYLFTRRWSRALHARRCAVLLATTPYFFVGAQYANMDMLVAGCIGCSVLLGAHAVLSAADGRRARLALIGAYAVCGLGVLAKGLIGVALPAGVLVAWLVVAGQRRLIATLVSPTGLVVLCVVTLPWLLAVEHGHPGFVDYFFVQQQVRRFAGSGFNNHEPFWFFVPVVLGLCLPWSLLSRHALRPSPPLPATGLPIDRLMWCWLAVVLVFFSIPSSKLIGYALPAVPPFAWLLSRAFAGAGRQGGVQRHFVSIAALTGIVSMCVVAGFAIGRHHSSVSLGRTLAGLRKPGEPVVYLRRHPYDLAFYARLTEPPLIVDDWSSLAAEGTDNWRKELTDASRFATAASSRSLIDLSAADPLLCHSPIVWVVAPSGAPTWTALHGTFSEVARTKDLVLLRHACPA